MGKFSLCQLLTPLQGEPVLHLLLIHQLVDLKGAENLDVGSGTAYLLLTRALGVCSVHGPHQQDARDVWKKTIWCSHYRDPPVGKGSCCATIPHSRHQTQETTQWKPPVSAARLGSQGK
jgi:hypothetical protein